MKRSTDIYKKLSELFVENGVSSTNFSLLAELYNIAEVAEDENFVMLDPIVKALEGYTDYEGLKASSLNFLQVLRRALAHEGKYNNCLRVLSEYSVFKDEELYKDESLHELWTWVRKRSEQDKD